MKNERIRISLMLVVWIALSGCSKDESPLFTRVSSAHTGVHFVNTIDETEEINVNTYMNIYTGAGVAAGDINNDGLADLFFSGNNVSSRIYLNKGDFVFQDITGSAGISNDVWATGVTMTDVNQDGWLDIYVCSSGSSPARRNRLYINDHDNTFTESAEAFGIADTRQSMHAAFFDYDGDADLDLFIITNPASYENRVNHIQPRKIKGESESTDVLYRNNGDNTFTDVSKEAGILVEGYSLGLAITDINADRWPDIYISNDFVGNDILYVNNQDGTFTDQSAAYFKHTSFAGMGNDAADINNDGLIDIVELDMRPEDNERQKLIIPPTGYDKYQLSLRMGYAPQFSRNTLQLNRGNNSFSEISFLAGISSTDWSWSPLLADYDNDGDKDLFVTNGFLRDLGNMDYITYQNIYNTPLGTVQSKTDKKLSAIKALDGAALHNYVYENDGHLTFTDRSEAWGITGNGFSHGAAYVDLDNDGDLDLVVNNMNSEAELYRNNVDVLKHRNYLRINFEGPEKNREGIGASVWVYHAGQIQLYEHYVSRGFESSVDGTIHVGLDTAGVVDSVQVLWPDGTSQLLRNVEVNTVLMLKYEDASAKGPSEAKKKERLFTLGSDVFDFIHRENDFVDYKIQPLLPHMHSRGGPGIAVADVNGDGLDDVYIGGAARQLGALYLQNRGGKFNRQGHFPADSLADDLGVLFFDCDNDGDEDLYVVRGGTEHEKDSPLYHDRLFVNNGNGDFIEPHNALPVISQSGSCVVATDYDHDGDLDLFVGGRIIPGNYPLPADSYVLRNESRPGQPRFVNVTSDVAPGLLKVGLVTAALWTDVDNDGWNDLLIVGEFMPFTYFRNIDGKRMERVETNALASSSGWWNSLAAADFDRDGDMDYVAGNLGLNTRYRGNPKEPICIYAKDYDHNGSIDPIMTYYLQGKKYLVHARDELISQISVMRLRFKRYQDYAGVTFEESFLESELEDAYVVCSERFETTYFENEGNGKFSLHTLPIEAQFGPVHGITAEDFNGDGFNDILAVGNDYSSEVSTGRYDASTGVFLLGNGKGDFSFTDLGASGFTSDRDARGLATVMLQDSSKMVVIGNNDDRPLAVKAAIRNKIVRVNKDETFARIVHRDRRVSKVEFYYGSGYLSCSTRLITIPKDAVSVEIFNVAGNKRVVDVD